MSRPSGSGSGSRLPVDTASEQSSSGFQSSSSSSQMQQTPLQPAHPAPLPNTIPGYTNAQNPSGPPSSHSLTGSLYQCADCKKRYSRPEHLARHIQTHTLGKRFSCQVCGKAFARADLLKRHAANHANDNDSTKKRRRVDSSPSAGRVSHACRACAAARVKCEEFKPCSRCRNRNLTCEYASPEAGSAATMHLVHLPGNPHNPPPYNVMPSMPSAQAQAMYHNEAHPTLPSTYNENLDLESNITKSEDDQSSTSVIMSQSAFDAQGYDQNMTAARLPFSNFLRDVIYEPGQGPSQAAAAQGQGLGVLDYCDDVNYELQNFDFGLLDNWNVDGMGERFVVAQSATPKTDESVLDTDQEGRTQAKIWMDSPWTWIPDRREDRFIEASHLPLPLGDVASQHFQESQQRIDRVVEEKLDLSHRDKILSIVLNMCQNNHMRTRVASSFPSVEMMDTLTHVFLVSHLCSVDTFIHFGTFAVNAQHPEWLATVTAAGAVMSPVPILRKFGYAIHEAVRQAIYLKFEDDNAYIRDLGLVQTLIMEQDIGLWSGNRRKMEIAESHSLAPVSMMRYRGRFHRSSYPVITVEPRDEGDILEEKWKRWRESESWKRLVFHCYLRDAQTSMIKSTTPLMSYAEMTLPLPESKELWFARTAEEWKGQFLLRSAGQSKRPPSIGDLIRDITLLSANQQRLDTQYAISIYLHGYWSLIWEWRRLCSVHRSNTFFHNSQDGPSLILNLRHQELCKMLRNFQSEWRASHSAQESLLLNLDFLNLYVSLNDLQLFTGKEGEEQARRIYPILQRWSESTEARQSVWYAGQILRQAKLFPAGQLKNFYAIGVYQATLTLWAYSVITRATRNAPAGNPASQEPVYLDEIESAGVQQFVSYGQGKPTIRGPTNSDSHQRYMEANLDDPRLCMSIAVDILRANFNSGKDLLPPVVENLCQLISQLGSAAWATGPG